MYVYFYDTPAQEHAVARLMLRIETRLAELELRGKIIRMSLLRDHRALVREAVASGAKTIVAVGNDRTFSTIAAAMVTCDTDATLGYIPINETEPIARILGIPPGVLGVDTLASRITVALDAGLAERHVFISEVRIAGGPITISSRPGWHIELAKSDHDVRVVNLGWRVAGRAREIFDPHDSLLTILIDPHHRSFGGRLRGQPIRPTYIPCRSLTINHTGPDALPVRIDDTITIKTPVAIEIIPRRLRVIVGRERLIT